MLPTLLECGPFNNEGQIRALFTDERIYTWRHNMPDANSPQARVNALIDHLHKRFDSNMGENALVLFLLVLLEGVSPQDDCQGRMVALADELRTALGNSSPVEQDSIVKPAIAEQALRIVVFDPAINQWSSETTFSIPPQTPNHNHAYEIGFQIQLVSIANNSLREPIIEISLRSSTDPFWNYNYREREPVAIEDAPHTWRTSSTHDHFEFEGGTNFICHSQGERNLGFVKMMVPCGQPETVVTFHYRIQAEGYDCRGSFSVNLRPANR